MWSKFKEYINSAEIGSLITRKDILSHVYGGKHPLTCLTIDVYKRCTELNGIISTAGRGMYIKLRDIPVDMSSTEFRERAYTDPIYRSKPSIFDYL